MAGRESEARAVKCDIAFRGRIGAGSNRGQRTVRAFSDRARSVAVLLAVAGSWSASAEEPNAALELLKAKGRSASLTILPAGLVGNPSRQVGEVIGMLLERGGMSNLDIGSAEFRPPTKAELAQAAVSFSEFVKADPPATEFVLYADFLGVAGEGFTEVRSLIANRQGAIVWQDRQTAQDADFRRLKPSEPMTCCLLVVERLRPLLNLDDPTRADAPGGRLATRWETASEVATVAEQKAMDARKAELKANASKKSVAIYPVRVGGQSSAEAAGDLVNLVNEAGLMKASVRPDVLSLDVKGDMNEQKVLWSMARAFSRQLQAHPTDADYALFVDCLMGRDTVGGVHFVLVDRRGDLVVVDYQNNHHADFQTLRPKSPKDSARLVLRRLERYCK